MKTLNSICAAIAIFLIASSCAVQQPRFQATSGSFREARARGEIKEFLTAMEAEALAAEKNAATTLFPQQYLQAVHNAYSHAADAAMTIGQLEKAIAHSEKALEFAEKTRETNSILAATLTLHDAYVSALKFEKGKQLLERGFGIVKDLDRNSDARIIWESVLYFNQVSF